MTRLQKEPESYGSVEKLREAGGIHRPELDGTERKRVEYAGSYSIVQYLGSVNPYSYPCRRVRASDLWCRRQSDVNASVILSYFSSLFYYYKLGSVCLAVGERSGGRITVLKPLFGQTLFSSLYKPRGALMAPF